MATMLVTAGRLPLLTADSDNNSSVDSSAGPYAVKPIRDHLSRFSPAKPPVRTNGQYRLIYDIIHWNWILAQRGTFSNSVVGKIVIERKTDNGRVIYEISQQVKIGGVDNFLEAQIICDADDYSSMRRWKLNSHYTNAKGTPEPLSVLTENGRCNDGQIRIESGNYEYGFAAKNPVFTQWTIPDLLIRKANPSLNVTFDLLQDLSLFKANQSLNYDGPTPLKLGDTRTVTLQTFSQTGQGILPIHYLLDDQGRPQLITSSILSWALSGQKSSRRSKKKPQNKV